MLHLLVLNDNVIRTCNKHFEKVFEYLLKMPNFVSIGFSKIEKLTEAETSALFMELFKKIPDNIIIYDRLLEINNINIPAQCKISLIIDDIHHQGRSKIERVNNLKKVSNIFSTYGYCFKKYYKTDIPVYWFPHCAAYDIPFNKAPVSQVLLSGRLNKEIYPFRNTMWELSKTLPSLVYMPVNCGYRIPGDSESLIYAHRYVAKLSQYLACVTCDASTDRPYIVAKHFEILSSGSLLLAGNFNTKRYFEKLGFIDGIHYIAITPENITEKIDYAMDPTNRAIIDKIRKAGYDKVRAYHFYANRAYFLKRALEDSGGFITYADGIANTKYLL